MGGDISTSLGYLPGVLGGDTRVTHPGGAGGPGGYLPSYGGGGGGESVGCNEHPNGGPRHGVIYPVGAEDNPRGGVFTYGGTSLGGGGYPPSRSPGGYLDIYPGKYIYPQGVTPPYGWLWGGGSRGEFPPLPRSRCISKKTYSQPSYLPGRGYFPAGGGGGGARRDIYPGQGTLWGGGNITHTRPQIITG